MSKKNKIQKLSRREMRKRKRKEKKMRRNKQQFIKKEENNRRDIIKNDRKKTKFNKPSTKNHRVEKEKKTNKIKKVSTFKENRHSVGDQGYFDDLMIKKMEEKLGINKKDQNWSKEFVEDGLDYFVNEGWKIPELHKEEEDGDEDSSNDEEKDYDEDEDDDEDEDEESEEGDEGEESEDSEEDDEGSEEEEGGFNEEGRFDDLMIKKMEEKLGINKKDQNWSKEFVEDGLDYFVNEGWKIPELHKKNEKDKINTHEKEKKKKKKKKPKKTSDNKMQQPSLYLPPQLREDNDEQRLADLKRKQVFENFDKQAELYKKQLRSLFNKLTCDNLPVITNQIITYFNNYPINIIKRSVTSLLIEQLMIKIKLTELLISTSAAHVALLHSFIGFEFSSYLVENIVKSLIISIEEQNKNKTHNLIVFLSTLYSLEVVGCKLIFTFIEYLLQNFQSFNIEVLLMLLRNVGIALRKDDPTALKEIILLVQEKVVSINDSLNKSNKDGGKVKEDENEEFFTSRVNFMLEMIYDLKNNKQKFLKTSALTQLTKLKEKIQQSKIKWEKNRGEGHDQALSVTWDDFINAESNGRWWLVGTSSSSAWKLSNKNQESLKLKSMLNGNDQKIYEKIQSQRMNTDIRKAVFVVIMSSEDYIDAFEKLLKLQLKAKQEREIIRVLIECCGQSKSYNPYFAYLGNRLCEYSKNFKITFQYTFWDQFKLLKETKMARIVNLAKLVSHLIILGSVSISVLKTLDFTKLTKNSLILARVIFTNLIVGADLQKIISIFTNLREVQELFELKEGILFLLLNHVKHQKQLIGIVSLNEKQKSENKRLLKKRIKIIEKIIQPQFDF
ncbi:nucleolar mif4g domain-containing protein [Anaeramoeba flamelloides]|uniref:Nucleolar mif4g domain-containing protein n=1 Tax=Anaeramoeba flamelloides TaxID=1746091 RepID=A0ABQ8Z3H1_9EUKA|nr:nucleolar mif4g domain-containing protein [Anaeramoeba flamelloides]